MSGGLWAPDIPRRRSTGRAAVQTVPEWKAVTARFIRRSWKCRTGATHTHTHRRGAGCDDRRLGRATKTDMWKGPDGRELAALRRAENESVPKIIINDTINLFLKTAISIFVISNQNSFRECRLTKLPPCILFEKTKNILIHRESKN